MTRDELNREYFDWMCDHVCDEENLERVTYHKLMKRLHEINFEYSIPMDGNRAEDGTDLRYRFAYENSYDARLIVSYLDDRPCSVLEMMIALAIRCEEHIMWNPDIGDRTGQWFWNMIVSLGLGGMTDDKYNESHVNAVIRRFLDRNFERNGEGSLFTIHDPRKDMRDTEIWYQMCAYLDEVPD